MKRSMGGFQLRQCDQESMEAASECKNDFDRSLVHESTTAKVVISEMDLSHV